MPHLQYVYAGLVYGDNLNGSVRILLTGARTIKVTAIAPAGSECHFTMPRLSAGAWSVAVRTADGTSNTVGITVVPVSWPVAERHLNKKWRSEIQCPRQLLSAGAATSSRPIGQACPR